MGDNFYIEIDEGHNGMGGSCWHNVTLRKHDDDSFSAEILQKQQFVEFPGLVHGKWEEDLPMEKVRKGTDFLCYIYPFKDGKAVFEWIVQPDGRYWQDEDGYGMTNDNEVILYSEFDMNGHFNTPFSDKIPDQLNH